MDADHTIDVASNYDMFAESYDGTYTDAVSRYERAVLRVLLTRYLKVGTILDLGCGTGMFLDLGFRPDPDQYLGVDISEGMLGVARRKHPEYRFLREDFSSATLPPSDNVIALNAPFSYVLDGNFDFLHRLVKSDGRLLVTLYGKGDGVGPRYDRGRTRHAPSIVRRYTVRHAREALRDFSLMHIRGSNACLPIGKKSPPIRWVANAILERLFPSWTEHIVLCGTPNGLKLIDR
jgi:SAM-dependent methyltransferase